MPEIMQATKEFLMYNCWKDLVILKDMCLVISGRDTSFFYQASIGLKFALAWESWVIKKIS